jgi:two-component system, NarL family, response regulator DevR
MGRGGISILVVDDDWLVRLGLTNLFAAAPQFGQVHETNTASGAVAAAANTAPDVVIMDVRLPDGSGIEACRQIRSKHPATRVMILTTYCDEEMLIQALLAGANGYLLKQTEPERLIAAVQTVAAGGAVLDAVVTDAFLHWMRSAAAIPGRARDGLSDHERKILPLIAQGKTNRQIAAELYLSEHTIKTYVSGLLKKLQLGRRAEAAAYIARQTGGAFSAVRRG